MKYLILGDGKLSTELRKQTNWDYISRKKQNFDFTNNRIVYKEEQLVKKEELNSIFTDKILS